MTRRNLIGMLAAALIFCSLSLLGFEAAAQSIYPAKDIEFLCYTDPGGGYDIFARGMSPFLTKYLKAVSPGAKGGEIKVKNIIGAGGAKQITFMYKDAKPDGYTIGDFNEGNAYNFLYGKNKLPFNVMEVTILVSWAKTNRVLVSKRFKTWEEMLSVGKKEPFTFVSSNPGAKQNLDTIFFKEGVGLSGKVANAGGTAQAVSALLRGDGDLYVIDQPAAKVLIESKEVNCLVSFTEERVVPEVPTIVEKGFPQLLKTVGGKCGRIFIAPPKLNPEAKRILIAAMKRMYADPEYKAYCEKTGIELRPYFEKEGEEALGEYVEMLKQNTAILKKYGL
ncbi:MAG: Bug family tripartite tricarboxylate transporter substrate binding protein [Thermodesulfobacteriota bacterium]